MSLSMQALTSTDDTEILACPRTLKSSHAGTGFMHESFNADAPARFTRLWFAWANTLFGELIITLHQQRRTFSATSSRRLIPLRVRRPARRRLLH